MKTITNHIASFGERNLDREIVTYLLRGLGLEYRGFVTSINIRVKEPWLFELYILLLTKEKMILKQLRFEKEQGFQANMTKFNALIVQEKYPSQGKSSGNRP